MTSILDSNPLISIVIPVFNGEQFVSIAINSVQAQSWLNWELLVVDDGSMDATAGICDEFAAADPRIKVFHQANGGVNAARARGIDHASGAYLTFLDADDTFPRNALEMMLEGFSDGVDVVFCGTDDTTLSQEDYIIALWKGQIKPGICTKMFRLNLFKQIDYTLERRLAMGEDLLLNSIYALHIHGAKSISGNYYLINNNNAASVTKTFKHNWEYEKFYFSKVDELFLNNCSSFGTFWRIQLAVNKCWLNAIKYAMLDGGRINYQDPEFKTVQAYFRDKKNHLGPSEKLIFILKNAFWYRIILRAYLWARKLGKR